MGCHGEEYDNGLDSPHPISPSGREEPWPTPPPRPLLIPPTPPGANWNLSQNREPSFHLLDSKSMCACVSAHIKVFPTHVNFLILTYIWGLYCSLV